jgi:hypothetical protein
MTEIEGGTQFIGVSASVRIPEKKSAQNNSFQEVYTIDDISSYAISSSTIQDFFVFSGGPSKYLFLFKRTENKVNGYPEWIYYDEENNLKYFISVNSAQDTWELHSKSSYIASIEDVQGEVPPSGDWDFDGDSYSVTIYYVSGSIQEVIENFALLSFGGYNIGAVADTGGYTGAGKDASAVVGGGKVGQ